MVRITERGLMVLIFMIFLFLTLSFSRTLNVFMITSVFLLVIFWTDKNKRFVVERRVDRFRSFLVGVVGYGVALVGFAVVTEFFEPGTVFSVFSSLRETFANELIFANIPFFTWLSTGVLIPIVESLGVMLLLEGVGDVTGIRYDLRRFSTWLVIVLVGALAIVFHTQAKGVSVDATVPLAVVGVFFVVNAVTMIWEGQALGGVIQHVLANNVALFAAGAVSVSLPVVVGIGFLVFVLFFPQRKFLLFNGG